MIGTQISRYYFAGGIYYGIGVNSYGYYEYTDASTGYTPNNDFGLEAEAGHEVAVSYDSVMIKEKNRFPV